MYLIFLLAALALQIWAWRNLNGRIQRGSISKFQGIFRFAGWSLLPLLILIGGFFALVGLEELLGMALVGERSALLVLPVSGIAILGITAFSLRVIFIQPAKGGRDNAATASEL